jgi:hypothetical protein
MRGRKRACCAGLPKAMMTGADHLEAEGQLHRRAGVGAFLVEDVLLHGRPAGAPVADRPACRPPALGMQYLLPAHEVVLLQTFATMDLVADLGWQLGTQEAAYLIAKGKFLGGEIQIHERKIL